MQATSLEFQARNVQWLEFELSNQCHYARLHDWCPRYCLGDSPKIQLPTAVIVKTVDFFKQYDFSGSVYFSIYNEPLLDERIFDLIKYVRREMPKCLVQMFTNGIELTEEKADRLAEAGVGVLRLSIYPEDSRDYTPVLQRLCSKGVNAAPVGRQGLVTYSGDGYDERIGVYDRVIDRREPCYMPIQYFLINCHGDVMLCWDDWDSTVTFGSILRDGVEAILMNPLRLEWLERLKAGRREGVCRGCGRPVKLCLSEYWDRLKL